MRILPLFLRGIKNLRLLCLKVILIVLSKYDSIDYGTNLWNMYFTTIHPYVEKIIQESESSEIPNSLFTCFLEMRNHLNLSSVLKREQSFFLNILSIMSIKCVSKYIVLEILSLVESLLNLEHGNHEDQDNILLHAFF